VLPAIGSKPAWKTFSKQQVSTKNHIVSLQAAYPPGQTDSPPATKKKKNWTINKELKTNKHQRCRVAENAPEKWGGTRSRYIQELSVNKGWKDRIADSRQVISCCLK
jgi:hypothetical protein